jgi:molybdopterin molybdotransferase
MTTSILISRGMISIEQARQSIQTHTRRLEAVEIPLAEALGRVLASEILADSDYPASACATMDGYVIRADDPPGTFEVIGEVPAGQVPTQALKNGQAMRIFTGAWLPENAGRVLMQEQVRREGSTIHSGDFPENCFIRPRASEAKRGAVVLHTGTRLGAAELAILAQVGAVQPRVVRAPRIRHLVSGDELVAPEQQPLPGQIRDSNSALIRGLLQGQAVSLIDAQRSTDDPAELVNLAAGNWDILLISGGASVGDYDFGAETLRRLGFTMHFEKINLRPGKPLTFASRGTQIVFVIPGNPVSHFVCFQLAIQLAIDCMAGLSNRWDFIALELVGDVVLTPHPRETFWPAVVKLQQGKLVVDAKRWSTSGDTFSLVGCNALIRVNATNAHQRLVETLLLQRL